jgi:hypothetical protein
MSKSKKKTKEDAQIIKILISAVLKKGGIDDLFDDHFDSDCNSENEKNEFGLIT